jgi:hypothetical protein
VSRTTCATVTGTTARAPNALKLTVAEVNEAVLQAIEEHALTPASVEQAIQLSERDDVKEQQGKLERERADVEKRIKRLLNAIEVGGDAASLVAKLRELEARKVAIASEIANLRPVPRLDPVVVETRLGEWRRLLRSSTTQARAVLQRVLQGRITFTPRADGSGYDFTAPTRFDKLFSGLVVKVPAHVRIGDTRGTERIKPEDTLDADYGTLLERVQGKGLASPRGPGRFYALRSVTPRLAA